MITVTDTALERIKARRAEQNAPGLKLRITVDSGGCSGFQYALSWDAQESPDDIVYADAVITDDVSLPYLDGATVDFVSGLMGSDFKITNPNAVQGCGCGTSFSV